MNLCVFLFVAAFSVYAVNGSPATSLSFSDGGDAGNEAIDSLEFQTAQCSQCGMTVFGSVATKVCGSAGCCLTPWDQGTFKEGGIDIMGGPKIGECENFTFNTDGSPDSIGKSSLRIRSCASKVYIEMLYLLLFKEGMSDALY